MTLIEIISATKDVLIGLAAAVTAIVAVKGLNTWSRQLAGSASFETARGLVRATLKVRDALEAFRSPFIMSHEFPEGYHDIQRENPEGDARNRAYADAWKHMYNNRWAPVVSAVREFDSSSLEAEALWGQMIRQATNKLRGCVVEIYTAIDTIIEDKAEGGAIFQTDKEFGKRMRAIVSASPSDKNNKLTQDIQTTITAIEDLVKPHLRREG